MVGVFAILYLPVWNPVDHFLLFYEPLEAEKTRLYPSSSPGLWFLLEFGQWWTKEIGVSVEKKIRGLILSSDTFLAGKWPSFSTEAQSSGQRPFLLAAAMYKTAISKLFLCPVGLKVFMHPCSCLSQRVLLFLLNYPYLWYNLQILKVHCVFVAQACLTFSDPHGM